MLRQTVRLVQHPMKHPNHPGTVVRSQCSRIQNCGVVAGPPARIRRGRTHATAAPGAIQPRQRTWHDPYEEGPSLLNVARNVARGMRKAQVIGSDLGFYLWAIQDLNL